MEKLISSGGVIIFEKRVLMIKRERTWVFPKGKVKEGENLIDTAKREIFEEVGIKVGEPVSKVGITKYRYRENGILFEKTVHYFLFLVEEGKVELEKGFLGYGWFYFDEVKRYITFKNDRRIFKKVVKILSEF